MSETNLDQIGHLDFQLEEDEKNEKIDSHWAHPVDPEKYWCGKAKKQPCVPGTGLQAKSPEEVNCVDCLHLYIEKGRHWWWNVNRAWYGDH